MVRRLLRKGHECVVFDTSPNTVTELVKEGAKGPTSLAEFVKALARPRLVWLMAPAAAVDKTISDVVAYMEPGDTFAAQPNAARHVAVECDEPSLNG